MPHKRLLHKIHHYGIQNNVYKWIQDFLSDRSQHVLIDSVSTKSAQVQSGVHQGSVIDPLLFLFYINDLPDCVLPGSTIRLFADESVLYRPIITMEDDIKLQEDLVPRVGERLADGVSPKEVPSLACNQQEEPCQEGLYHPWRNF